MTLKLRSLRATWCNDHQHLLLLHLQHLHKTSAVDKVAWPLEDALVGPGPKTMLADLASSSNLLEEVGMVGMVYIPAMVDVAKATYGG